MINDKTLNRVLQDITNGEALSLGGLLQLLEIVVSHRAHKVDRQVGTVIGHTARNRLVRKTERRSRCFRYHTIMWGMGRAC